MNLEHANQIPSEWWHGSLFDLGEEFDEEFDTDDTEAGDIDGEAGEDELEDGGDEELDTDGDAVAIDLGDLDLEMDDEDSDSVVIFETDEFEAGTEWEDTLEDRDRRIREYDGSAGHEDVRDRLRETGTAEDVQDALEDLGTDEEDVTSPEAGLLDMRNVTRLLAGDTTVDDYYRERVERPADDLAIGVSVDMSGSMSGDELDTKAAVGAFLFAVEKIGGEVVANGWDDVASVAHAYMVTGPYESFAWRHLNSIEPNGGTPTGYGMYECALMLERVHASTKLLFVITDGRPTTRAREDETFGSAMEEAEETAAELRDWGIDVIGIGFGAVSQSNLEQIFGPENSHHVDLEELPDALTEAFADRYDTTGPTIP
ncbi:vWA domain-containing protein [Halomontanus rarus]|uniref:vWA domain-containing protein n=1 Tax=Halomontanus rarus TaxID=3034020 RepID=UPI00307B4F3B